MTTQTQTMCIAPRCSGEIRPSHVGPAPIVGPLASKGEIVYPAACVQCGKTYVDVVSVPMTIEDLVMVGDRLSPSTRQELTTTATELTTGRYRVEIAEDRARDLASKAANLGLLTIASTVRQELSSLAKARRER